jgi:hypothetical protein
MILKNLLEGITKFIQILVKSESVFQESMLKFSKIIFRNGNCEK